MYTRYYNPEIFLQTLDGIDRSRHIVATYYMDDCLPGEDFVDHFALIQAMTLEGSTGSWEKVAEDTLEMRERLSGKMVGYYELPTDNPSRRSAVVQLAFPIDAWIDNVPMMLLSIAGNCFAYSPKLRLLDIFLPDHLLASFKGPKFGVPGIRQLLEVPERPMSLHILKPKMGMTPKEVAEQCYQTALGGVDMIKDDEMTSDVYNSKYDDRLKAVNDALDRAEAKTGKRPIYFLSITDEPRRIFDKAAHAVELGARGLLVCYSAGLSVIRQLAEDPAISVPILYHASHQIAQQPRIAWPVSAKLARICGADLMLTPTYWSSIPMVSLEEGIRTSQVKLAPLGHIKPIFPMPCAGVYPGLAPILIGEYGPDIVIPAGGGMLGHPDGYTAGAKAWQQAIAGAMSNENFLEFAKHPENRELRRALEKWGYLERPKTPWLRVAPKFHPRPMKFDIE
ncbi:MAG: RuBisCO large subunit C-terminal-like domain-containing protein [Candidatus Omnitrophica bacterium]|nr:RuBisCO large subunit C-terminal-like domain-containing protein [Candidatus Omnitrophota bacterium]